MELVCIVCPETFNSSEHWGSHIRMAHHFRVGFISKDPTEFIPEQHGVGKEFSIWFFYRKNAAKNGIEPPSEHVLDGKVNASEGSIWCCKCEEVLELGGHAPDGEISAEALAHLKDHIQQGFDIKPSRLIFQQMTRTE
ncbi:hypothetical protein BDV18DRAFT_138527 [Aspergillus unguis]